jgi:mannose-6-phosphate isomerase class I
MELNRYAYKAYADDVGKQMIEYCRRYKDTAPEAVIPFVVDPIRALTAYKEAKHVTDTKRVAEILEEVQRIFKEDGHAYPAVDVRIGKALSILYHGN